MLGSLFNGVEKPGDDLLQDCDGSFSLRSDHKVRIASTEDTTFESENRFTVDAEGDVGLTTSADLALNGQKLSVKGDVEITIEAGTKLTLKCGPSQVQLSSAGVTVSGPMINLG